MKNCQYPNKINYKKLNLFFQKVIQEYEYLENYFFNILSFIYTKTEFISHKYKKIRFRNILRI